MIDEGLTDEWRSEVVAAAEKFQQGDLIGDPPIGYAASLRYAVWALTRQEAGGEADPGDDVVHLSLDRDDVPGYGILVSQTCDIAEGGRTPVHPWIEVCPVYEREAVDRPPEYLFPLDRMEAPDGRMWVADLRLTVPLEKGLLVGREPIDPFAGSERNRIRFGLKLGERRARAALSDGVHILIAQTLSKRSRNNRKAAKAVRTCVYKLMLQIPEGEGTRLDPKAVRLHVIYQASQQSSEERMRDWFQSWWDNAHAVAEEDGVRLLPVVFHDRTSMDVASYDSLIPIENPM